MATQQPITTDLSSASTAQYSNMTYSHPAPDNNTDGQSFNPVPIYQQNYNTPQQVYGAQDMNHNIPNYSHGINMDHYKPQYDYSKPSNMYDNTDSGLGYESNGIVYNGDVSMNYYSNESGNQFTQHSQITQNSQITQQGNTAVSVANNHLSHSQSPPTPYQPGKRGPGRPTKKIFAPGKDKAYVCPTCFKPLGTYQSLKKHMVTHTGERQYSCHLCSNSYTQKHNLTKHLLVHSGEKPFSCEHCGASYRTRHLLTNHMKHHQKNKSGSAGPVLEQTKTSSKLREMLMNNHSESAMDTSLDHNESSLDSSTLTDNSADFNSPEREMCEMNSSFKEMSPEFESSIKQVPEASLAEKFDNLGDKVVNKSEQSNTEPGKGLEVGKLGSKKLGSQLEKETKPKLECDKCEQVFESRIKFMRHKKEHNNGQKSLSCDFCNASFRWKAALDIHMRKHKGQKLPSYELKGLKIKNGNRITLKIGTSDKKETESENIEKEGDVAISSKKPVEVKTDRKESPKKMDVNEPEKVTPEKPSVKSGKKIQPTVSNVKISPKPFQNEEKVSETQEADHEIENNDKRKRKLSNRKHVENPFIGSMPRSEIAQQPDNQITRNSNRAHKKAMDISEGDDLTEETRTGEIETGKSAKFECDLCGQKFTQNYSLKRHKRNKICTK